MSGAESNLAERARSIFERVMDSPASRSDDLLASLCGGDRALESEVLRLLAAHERAAAEGFLGDVDSAQGMPSDPARPGKSALAVDSESEPSEPESNRDEKPAHPPAAVPKYEMLHRIGEGQFAEVWLARQEWLGHLCAIRFFERASAGEVESLRTYKRVAANHAHLAPVEEVGVVGDWVYCVMPRADNAATGDDAMTTSNYQAMTLRRHLKRSGHLDVHEVARIGAGIMSGVAHLHERDLVHQDIKPENILSVDGGWRLADFGLLGREGGRRGYTPGYNPPDSDVGSPYHDRYALGVTLFELLTGKSSGYFSRIQLQQDLESETDTQRRELLECILGLCTNNPPRGFVSDRDAEAKLRDIGSSSDPSAREATQARVIRRFPMTVIGGVAALAVVAVSVLLLVLWKPGAATTDPAGRPAPNAATQPGFAFGGLIQDAYIEVFRATPEDPKAVRPVGRLSPGAPTPGDINEGDALRFIARFNEPAYVYLVALAASGGESFLCWPETGSAAPPPIESLEYPPPGPEGEQVLWNLEEGPGLHAFAMVVSAEPLPPFGQWSSAVGTLPWPEDTGLALADGTGALTPIVLTRGGEQRLGGSRAPGERRVLPGPIESLSAHLRRLGPPLESLAYVVPVQPAE